jgi:hypothetical protein
MCVLELLKFPRSHNRAWYTQPLFNELGSVSIELKFYFAVNQLKK